MDSPQIISHLPYTAPFLFVDELESVRDDGCIGYYTFQPDSDFYRGHFQDRPVTPGVILIETMAQIGVVCLGIFLLRERVNNGAELTIALSSSEVDFYLPVLPCDKVKVISSKKYFRFNKLKCQVEMRNTKDELICRGTIAGMIGHGA